MQFICNNVKSGPQNCITTVALKFSYHQHQSDRCRLNIIAENLCPSVSSVKEKLKVSREREEECSSNLHFRRQDLLRTRTAAIDVVLAHQKAIVQLDLELEENSKDIKNVHVHFMSERETILNSFVGSLLKEKKKAAEVQPNAPQFVAPRHTPAIVCFLRTHLNQPGMVSCDRKGSVMASCC
ncbi:hypothetical protein OUZ56_021430 [Daphnia magna]|uniref:Uncharacterized protein n=1 Tax=Daphnia magna TaxID=35525 RepID=A0ABQ9ZHB9_9CRUS|nr:hypothetical protein OUZ56_021430 [Daphnia magna]